MISIEQKFENDQDGLKESSWISNLVPRVSSEFQQASLCCLMKAKFFTLLHLYNWESLPWEQWHGNPTVPLDNLSEVFRRSFPILNPAYISQENENESAPISENIAHYVIDTRNLSGTMALWKKLCQIHIIPTGQLPQRALDKSWMWKKKEKSL